MHHRFVKRQRKSPKGHELPRIWNMSQIFTSFVVYNRRGAMGTTAKKGDLLKKVEKRW